MAEPDWATPGASAGAPAPTVDAGVPTTGTVSAAAANSGGGSDRSRCILTCLSICNFGISALMATLGVLTILNFTKPASGDFSEVFLSCYMILFAVLLATYEVMWWSAVPWVNKLLRKNFGFMYGLRGKGLYLIFVAFLCLGLGGDNSVKILTWVTGLCFLAFGVLHIFIVCMHPDINQSYQAPTAGLDKMGADQQNVV